MEPDPLKEVRAIRRKISAECNDDPKKVFEYYLKHQEESKRAGKYQFVSTPFQGTRTIRATDRTDEREPE